MKSWMWIHHRDLKQMKSRQWGNPVMCGAINLSRSFNNRKPLTTEIVGCFTQRVFKIITAAYTTPTSFLSAWNFPSHWIFHSLHCFACAWFMPMMTFSGVRISCDIVARNCDLASLAACAWYKRRVNLKMLLCRCVRACARELIRFFPRIDRFFPAATLKLCLRV